MTPLKTHGFLPGGGSGGARAPPRLCRGGSGGPLGLPEEEQKTKKADRWRVKTTTKNHPPTKWPKAVPRALVGSAYTKLDLLSSTVAARASKDGHTSSKQTTRDQSFTTPPMGVSHYHGRPGPPAPRKTLESQRKVSQGMVTLPSGRKSLPNHYHTL